jgi:hypothetical protein
LRCELSARGYDVSQDVKRIRAGRPWDEEVPEGLRNSQVVLALLSPYSVRRALDADNSNATDSVCLDEIAYARGARTSLGLPRIIIKEVKPKETMSRPSPARNHFKLGLRHAQGLIDATTWKEFNGIAAAHGVWLDLRANGFVFTHRRSLVRVKASSISRHLAKPALEARLGTFIPAEYQQGREAQEYEKKPRFARVDTSRLSEEYQAQRDHLKRFPSREQSVHAASLAAAGATIVHVGRWHVSTVERDRAVLQLCADAPPGMDRLYSDLNIMQIFREALAVITIMGVGIVFSPIILTISRLKRESGLIVLFCLLGFVATRTTGDRAFPARSQQSPHIVWFWSDDAGCWGIPFSSGARDALGATIVLDCDRN